MRSDRIDVPSRRVPEPRRAVSNCTVKVRSFLDRNWPRSSSYVPVCSYSNPALRKRSTKSRFFAAEAAASSATSRSSV